MYSEKMVGVRCALRCVVVLPLRVWKIRIVKVTTHCVFHGGIFIFKFFVFIHFYDVYFLRTVKSLC